MNDAFCELEPFVGTKAACFALGRSRASHCRRPSTAPRPAGTPADTAERA
jgi:hypothetical protein